MPDPARYRVELEPIGRRVEIPAGSTLLEAAQTAGVELTAVCGGAGTCGRCRVRVVEGPLSKPTPAEELALTYQELAAGFRLACQAVPLGDVRVDVPVESLATAQRLQLEGQQEPIELEPPVVALDVETAPATLYDLTADWSRVVNAAGRAWLRPTWPVLTSLSERLRSQEWAVRLAIRQDEVVAVLRPGTPLLGLAVDLGTTKIAAYLVELEGGRTLGLAGAPNPQIAYGEDVISRIAYANREEEGRALLQRRAVEALNELIDTLCREAGTFPEQIVEAVVVGNTAMHHLFAGLPVRQLGTAPYVPAVSDPIEIPARDLGLRLSPGSYVYLPPNIAGYVGADHVAMLLATGLHEDGRTRLALDIGTNTEISLAVGNRLLCCSCASGPAFEGAHIRDGMRAAPGAIERVQLVGDEVRLQTVGHAAPVGICGSGILDAVAELRRAGVLNERGGFQVDRPRVRRRDGQTEFVLVPAERAGTGREIVVTRADVNEIQLAKAAIRAGIEVLLAEAGVRAEELEEVIVAGAFGTYLDLRSALTIGMFPPLPVSRFRQVGNAAGAGARRLLLSLAQRRLAQQIARRVAYIELTTHPRFTPEFVQAMYLW
ncbi:MAG: ASKHA domain-containing protein [Chloroflexia bacterium]